MRKIIFAVVAAGALLLGISLVLRALESPESKIRRRLLEMAEDFGQGRAGPCCRGLAEEFRDETTGAGGGEVHAVLVQMTLSERDPETKEFLHRVELPEEAMAISLDPADPTKARVELIAVFEERAGPELRVEWRVEWRVAVTAEMAEGEDGWQVLRTTHETLEGGRLR